MGIRPFQDFCIHGTELKYVHVMGLELSIPLFVCGLKPTRAATRIGFCINYVFLAQNLKKNRTGYKESVLAFVEVCVQKPW
jgi:hypothetical protein